MNRMVIFHPPEMVLFSAACFGQNRGNTSRGTKQLNLATGGQTCDTDFSNLCLKKHVPSIRFSSISNTWRIHANLLASTERATSLAQTSEEQQIYSFKSLHDSCQCKAAGYFCKGIASGHFTNKKNREQKKYKRPHVFNAFDAIPGAPLWPHVHILMPKRGTYK